MRPGDGSRCRGRSLWTSAGRAWLAALVAPLGLLAGCPGPPSNLPDVLLVTIDTLRADHLSFYGYERETTPHLAEWVDEATVFERCYTPLPLTDPTMSSIMTGLHPMRHGIRHVGQKLSPRISTLAEMLESEGYQTAAFVSRSGLLQETTLGRGFGAGNFVGGTVTRPDMSPRQAEAERWQRRADSVTEATVEWLRANPARPRFVWLHYFDPHAFYDPPEEFRDRFVAGLAPSPAEDLRAWWGSVEDIGQTIARYDAEILTVDHFLAQVVSELKRQGRWDSTLVIVTSDHGESLGEHGYMDHGEWLYEEQIHVALLMRWPGHVPAGRRVPQLVRSIDIAPTVLDLVGLRGEKAEDWIRGVDGRSLVPLLDGKESGSRLVFIESEGCPRAKDRYLAPGMDCYPPGVKGKLRGVYDGRWKLIVTPRRGDRLIELYDVANDPEERTNLAAEEPERVREMMAALDTFWSRGATKAGVDVELTEQLRALGYAQ